MARILETVYRVARHSWIPEHNRPVVYWTVTAGHDARDYQAENYSAAQTVVGKFSSEAEALARVDALKRGDR